ncbi:MAG TPA: hypothetical protein VLI90_13575, partial [Tepidisphaeraceae bacterium]|nr:hypothetical protein [Tepidisphaeraceae bacterium]
SPTPLDPAPIAIDNNPPSSSNDPQPIAASPTATPPVVLASPRPPFIPPPGGPLVGSTPSIPEPCGIFLGVITPLLLQRPRRSV